MSHTEIDKLVNRWGKYGFTVNIREDYTTQLYKGKHSEKKIPTGKVHGFKKFDTVRYLGKEYFVKGRRSTGYLVLMDITGKAVDFTEKAKKYGIGKTVKAVNCKRLAGRSTWLFSTKQLDPKILQ